MNAENKYSKINGIEVYSISQVVELSGLSLGWLRVCIKKGTLKTTKVGNRLLVIKPDYLNFMNKKRKVGRPRKTKKERNENHHNR